MLENCQPYLVNTQVAHPVSRPLLGGTDEGWITQHFYHLIEKVASGNANVHICGETGTGKQVAATMVHALSGRSAYPLITVDCAAHHNRRLRCVNHKGAETPGKETPISVQSLYRQAGHGTLILDDVSRMRLDLQAELLRIRRKPPDPVEGGDLVHSPHPRIVMTSYRSPQTLLRNGAIKPELYDHLHPVVIHLLALRHCKEDIPALANFYFRYYGNRRENQLLPASVITQLVDYDWPGNHYELQNTIQRYLAYDEIIFLHLESIEGREIAG